MQRDSKGQEGKSESEVSASLQSLLGSEVCVKSKSSVLFGGIQPGLKNQRPHPKKEESVCGKVLQIRLKSLLHSLLGKRKDLGAQKNKELRGIGCFYQRDTKHWKSY